MPKVSVIMSIFNEERYLKESIESILNQTYGDFEFIICDDGSTDSSLDIVRSYMKKDERIILLKNETNLGLAASLNRCLAISKGEYIARMDADDIALKDRFKKQVDFLDNNQRVAVICGGINFIDENNHIWGKKLVNTPITKKSIFLNNPIVHPTVMMRKEAIMSVGGYTVSPITRKGQDFDLWCKLIHKGYVIAGIDAIVLNYRESQDDYKNRGFKRRLLSIKLQRYWRRKFGFPIYYDFFVLKQIIAIFVPKRIMYFYREKKFSQ